MSLIAGVGDFGIQEILDKAQAANAMAEATRAAAQNLYDNVGVYLFTPNSVSELRTKAGNAGSRSQLLGYNNPGDGGGGVFYWDADSMLPEDGGTVFKATGTVKGRHRRLFDGPVIVKWFGATGNGTTDDAPAIQKAINYAVANLSAYRMITILFPAGYYMINTAINAADKNGIQLKGEGGRTMNASLIGNTGAIAVDFSGSSESGMQDLSITVPNGLSNPSTIGVQFALNKNAPNQETAGSQRSGLNCSLTNVSILMGDFSSANNGLGAIPLVNCRSEEFALHNVMLRGNTGCIFTTSRTLQPTTGYNLVIGSSYTPLQDDGTGSMGVVNWSGQNSLQIWGQRTPGMILNGVNSFNFHGYIGRISTGNGTYETAIRITQYTYGLRVHATIESFSQALNILNTIENCEFMLTVANQTASTTPVVHLENFGKIMTSRISVGFGNPNESGNRYFIYTPIVNAGNTLTNASLSNSVFNAAQMGDNRLFVSPHLLKMSGNCEFNSAPAFSKINGYVRGSGYTLKDLGATKANGALLTGNLCQFSRADNATKTAGNGGYYHARVNGSVRLGSAQTNGLAMASFEGWVSVAQNSNGVLATQSTLLTITTKSSSNPSYQAINTLTLALRFTETTGFVDLVLATSGAGSNEGVFFLGVIELQSDFPVNQSVILN